MPFISHLVPIVVLQLFSCIYCFMAQYQSYCHINFVLNIKGAGLINKFTAFIAIFTFYDAGQNGLFKMTYLFLLASLNSQIAPLQALKSSLKQDICFGLLNKKAQVTLLPKNEPSIQSPFYKPTITFISTDFSILH